MSTQRPLSLQESSPVGQALRPEIKDQAVPSELGYRPDIDGLRAVAILAVLIFHAGASFLPGGFCGVDVFFVISGFLITGIILRELQSGRFTFRQFYARRVRRLFPALVVVLPTTFILGWLVLLPDEFQTLGSDAAASAAFFSNLVLFDDVRPYFAAGDRPLTHFWSLGVEEQFYFFWPLLIHATWKLGRRWVGPIAVAVIAASFLANIVVVSFDPQAAFFLPWSRLWELSLGAALANAYQSRDLSPSSTAESRRTVLPNWLSKHRYDLFSLAGVALLAFSFLALNGKTEFPGVWALAPSVGTALLIWSGSRAWINRRLLSCRPMVFIGLISYPLYLWHWPLLCYLRLVEPAPVSLQLTAATVLLGIALAYLTYRFVELPLRHSRGKPRVLIALCVPVACYAVVGILISVQYIPARGISPQVERLTRPSLEDWLSTESTAWTILPERFVETGTSTRKTLFIGDSLMEQYYPRIERIVADAGARANSAVFAVRGACSLPYEFSWAYGRAACQRHVEKALDYARREDVDTVVLASAWHGYFMTHRDGKSVLNPRAAPALERLKETIIELRKLNKRVYLVLVAPIDPRLDPRAMIRRTVWSPGFQAIEPKLPLKTDIDERYAGIQSVLRQIAHDTGAEIIDPVEALCGVTCPALTPGGEPMYHDAGHLRPSFVREHAGFMDETVLRQPLNASGQVSN